MFLDGKLGVIMWNRVDEDWLSRNVGGHDGLPQQGYGKL